MKQSCDITRFSPGRTLGSSPSNAQDYVLVLFDISNQKKYRILTKMLKRFGARIQKSVFEAQLNRLQINEMSAGIERLMTSEQYYDEDDSVRIYCVAGNCKATVFGSYSSSFVEENVVL